MLHTHVYHSVSPGQFWIYFFGLFTRVANLSLSLSHTQTLRSHTYVCDYKSPRSVIKTLQQADIYTESHFLEMK